MGQTYARKDGAGVNQVRQGDVLLIGVPKRAIKGKRRRAVGGRHVLVRGEATGHHHSVAADLACYYAPPELGEAERAALGLLPGAQILGLLEVGGAGAALLHQEHDPIAIGAGQMLVVRQVEYTPSKIVAVAD
jgi:hypothetical protein